MAQEMLAQFKAAQREAWALFIPLEALNTIPAAQLVKHTGVRAGQKVLDVGCGTGVVALTAARMGAHVQGLDLSPVLLERARSHALLAGLEIGFQEGDAEALPYGDASFDVVMSQFGHMFAPRPEVALSEMLRVLKPGGTIAFSTWPPHHFTGQMFALVAKHVPPPPGIAPPVQWGDPTIIRQRFGDTVSDILFDTRVLDFPALSIKHYRKNIEETLGPVAKLVGSLQSQPEKLAAFRSELEGFIEKYYDGNIVRQHFLMTRATKR